MASVLKELLSHLPEERPVSTSVEKSSGASAAVAVSVDAFPEDPAAPVLNSVEVERVVRATVWDDISILELEHQAEEYFSSRELNTVGKLLHAYGIMRLHSITICSKCLCSSLAVLKFLLRQQDYSALSHFGFF